MIRCLQGCSSGCGQSLPHGDRGPEAPFEQLRPEDRQPSKCDRGLGPRPLAPRWTLSQVLCSSDEEGAKVLGRRVEGAQPHPTGSGRRREAGSGCGAARRRRRPSRQRSAGVGWVQREDGCPGRGKGLGGKPQGLPVGRALCGAGEKPELRGVPGTRVQAWAGPPALHSGEPWNVLRVVSHSVRGVTWSSSGGGRASASSQPLGEPSRPAHHGMVLEQVWSSRG